VPLGTTALPATIGVTTTMLPAGATALIDAANSVEVALLNAGMALFDADTAALLGGANRAMVGREMLQFGRATPVAPGRWRLSHLWRGRRGTEDAVEPHPAGTPFVFVQEGTWFVLPSAQAVAGVRVMASGLGDADPWPQAICPTAGRAALPLAPVHPVVRALPSGDIRLGWTRRSRLGWAWRDGADAPLGEEREAYQISWFEGSAAVAEPTFIYTAALRARHMAMGLSTMAFDVRQSGDSGLSPPLVVKVNLS